MNEKTAETIEEVIDYEECVITLRTTEETVVMEMEGLVSVEEI